jgi:hypothetical protein
MEASCRDTKTNSFQNRRTEFRTKLNLNMGDDDDDDDDNNNNNSNNNNNALVLNSVLWLWKLLVFVSLLCISKIFLYSVLALQLKVSFC